MTPPPHAPPLRSFWMGGYEGADHVNSAGEALDMVRATGHLDRLDEDYRRARRLGLLTVRESIGWRLCEGAGGAQDLGRVRRIARAARAAGMQPLWTLMHYGLPPDLTLLDDALIPRFARFAAQVARTLRRLCPEPRVYTPINEISFLAWAASASELMGPAGRRPPGPPGDSAENSRISGYLIKRRLVRAALAGIAAIREVDPGARFLHVEPVVHVAAPPGRPELEALARQIRDYQWQTLDLLGGRLEPELGGHPAALDWLGLNHYHSSQWEAGTEQRLSWHRRDARRQPLSGLLQEVWLRYRRPLLLAETSHVGMGRDAWLHEVAGEALRALALGVPLQGVCLYPLLDRPDWQPPGRWHRSGLWHVPGGPSAADRPAPQARSRLLVAPYAAALREWRHLPQAPAPRPCRALVLLPTRWEALDASLQQLLRALSRHVALQLLQAPVDASGSTHAAPPALTRHTLGAAMELLQLHGPAPSGTPWSAPPCADTLRLLRQALAPPTGGGRLLWLMRWSLHDGAPGWWRGLAAEALVLQPGPRRCDFSGASGSTPGHTQAAALADAADLVLCEAPRQQADWSARHPGARRLCAGLAAPWRRAPVRGSYECDEVAALLGPRLGPRLLVLARPDAPPDLTLIDGLLALRPHWRFVIVGQAAPAERSAALAGRSLWLEELAPSLQPALLAACDAGLVAQRACAATEHLWPELLPLAEATGLPVLATPLAELRALPARGGLYLADQAVALALGGDALLERPRATHPCPSALAPTETQAAALAEEFARLLQRRQRAPVPP